MITQFGALTIQTKSDTIEFTIAAGYDSSYSVGLKPGEITQLITFLKTANSDLEYNNDTLIKLQQEFNKQQRSLIDLKHELASLKNEILTDIKTMKFGN